LLTSDKKNETEIGEVERDGSLGYGESQPRRQDELGLDFSLGQRGNETGLRPGVPER
jgi:hypothetical protein